MKKFCLFVTFLVSTLYSYGQSQVPKVSLDSIKRKWIKACVNLESKPNFFVSKIWADWQQKIRKGHKLNNDAAKQIQERYRKIAYRGTGIFLFYKNKHYLITARHCLIDTSAFKPNYVFERIFLGDNGSPILKRGNGVFDSLPEVRYFDGHTSGKTPKYILSNREEDIGIIALDDIPVMGRQFVAMLYDKGYVPIKLSDIEVHKKLIKEQPIISIGFPGEISELEMHRKNIDSSIKYWQSPYVTLPVVAEGHIKNVYTKTLTGNIASHHGNSGGPIISNNKLIGINISITRPIRNSNTEMLQYYIEEAAYFSKAANILTLLKILESRFAPNDKPYVIDKDYKKHFTGMISGGVISVSKN